ncbi:MAG: hypothetical protein RL322_1936 [Pseudomonadota bacterium]|jgi:DNA-binding NtrC family response regulator
MATAPSAGRDPPMPSAGGGAVTGQGANERLDDAWRMLLVGRRRTGGLANEAEPSQAWSLKRVPSPEAAHALIQIDRPVGCVARIDSALGAQRARLEAIQAAYPELVWVGIADPQILECDPLRSLAGDAFDACLSPPASVREILACIEGLVRVRAIRGRARVDEPDDDGLPGIQGSSPPMRQLAAAIRRVRDSDAPVLILGETGTGKELVARAIHQGSRRSNEPMIAVNCGAIAESLMQSELFGHERHAFTGAMQRRAGSFEAADRGSVFLDEVGELPLGLQPALLRVLQERSVTRLGSSQAVPVDFRLIAATHIDLQAAVVSGRFREDLFFRINVLSIKVPPLREREGDVIMLAEHFREQFYAPRRTDYPRGFSRQTRDWIQAYRWPGNVRELINRVQRAVVMAEGPLITVKDMGVDNDLCVAEPTTLAHARRRFERALVRDSLRLHGHSVSAAARALGVSRVTLYRMMEKLGLAEGGRSTVSPTPGESGTSSPDREGAPGAALPTVTESIIPCIDR